MIKDIFHLNQQGQRENLEDCIYPAPGKATMKDRLFIVCDGVGGESKGEVASRIACDSIGAFFSELKGLPITEELIERSAVMAVSRMKDYTQLYPEAEKMSTTLTLVYLETNSAWAAWCGDSRIYHIRDGLILWQSQDHSLVGELLATGQISEEEAKSHPRKNVILRSLTASESSPRISTHFINDLKPADFLLLCTDGLLEKLDESALRKIFSKEQNSQNKQRQILNLCEGETRDNYSMYLVHLANSKSKKNFYIIILFACLLVTTLVLAKKWGLAVKAEQKTPTNQLDTTKRKVDNRAFNILNSDQSIP